ncbi:DNA polymerase III subunit chi [uncultured Erythrobacter sp.]|uniref:DNA polymerase III subunit chi n=1 Tax=uncultured Erythrobacter sp. TaxID=263913 RepID=UPI002629F378|nr:DNA polymerase III subunit chi [uncultured Erythrobacter sp.]
MKVDFWQLSRDPVEKVVALIAQRVLDSGERLLVVSDSHEQREAISQGLWRAGPDSFLANGDASGPQPEAQPILLSEVPEPANKASHVIYADGNYREADGFDRTFLLFDDGTVEQARATWRSLDGAEIERAFFRQDGGKWVKVA